MKHLGLGGLLCAVLSSLAPLAFAANDGSNPSSNDSQSAVLSEIVVTAQKREERLKDVPISISVLSGADLDRSSSVSVTEALNSVPGVVATAGALGGGTQISVRGVGASGPVFNGSSPIGYYADSVPFGLVKNAIAPDSDAYDLARIEVLRGPQGTLYGASAENGIVRVLTRDADLDAFEFKARTLASTTDGGGFNYRGDVAVNVPIIEGKLAARAVLGYEDVSGWINTPTTNHANDGVLRNYRLKINAQPTDELSIGVSAWSSQNNYGAPSAAANNARFSGPLPQPISNDFEAYGLKVGYVLPSFTISSSTSYLHYRSDSFLDFDALAPGIGIRYHTYLPANVLSEELTLNSAASSAWIWTAGAFYRDADDRQFQRLPGEGAVIQLQDYTNESKSAAVYGQIGRRFADDKLEWMLGARYFHDNVTNRENLRDPALGIPTTVAPLYDVTDSFNSTTPKAVLTWYPNHDVTLYGSYSEGFRSGFPQNASVAVPNRGFAPLKPDKLHNFELGAKGDFLDRRLSFETALYYIKWDDVQQTLSVPYGSGSSVQSVTALINGKSASGLGVDFSIVGRPVEGLDLGISAGWSGLSLDSQIISQGVVLFEKGDRLNYSPEYTGGAFADYRFPLGGTGYQGQFSVSGSYSSKQVNHVLNGTNAAVLTGDTLLTGHGSFELISPHRWSASLFVDNFTNESGGLPPIIPYPDLTPRIRPRTMGVQFDYHYR